MSDHYEAPPNPPHRFQRRWSSSRRRFFPFAIFFFFFILLFRGGTAAILYLIFSEYSGVRNIWLLLCGAPFVVIFLLIVTIFSLYTRFGKPLGEIFNAIDAVAEGNLSPHPHEHIRIETRQVHVYLSAAFPSTRIQMMACDARRGERGRTFRHDLGG